MKPFSRSCKGRFENVNKTKSVMTAGNKSSDDRSDVATEPLPGHQVRLGIDTPLALDCGLEISDFPVAYQTYGKLNADKSNAIMVCHALTGDQFVAETHPLTDKPGWWDMLVGAGKTIDTDTYFVICCNILGGCMGTLGPKEINPELTTSEPYVMGSHATCSGAWASGPEDYAPDEYQWGYNRMMTVDGLFGAGDTIGGTAHKFSSGSFTEGRIAGKAAIKYIDDLGNDHPEVSEKEYEDLKQVVFQPMENYDVGRNEITGGTVSPSYLLPMHGLQRLEKIMDEYVGGISAHYTTNEQQLLRGLELLNMLKEDLPHLGAEDLHQLQRSWELQHRVMASECVTHHTMFRTETRWPGYYYRADHPKLDDTDWHCFTLSQYDRESDEWAMEKAPVYHIVD